MRGIRALARLVPILVAVALLVGSPLAGRNGLAHAAAVDSTLARLSRDATPTHQSVELTLDPDKSAYQGRTIVTLQVTKPVDELRFHARALTIDSATVRGPKGAVAVSGIEVLTPDQARVHLGQKIGPGSYTLTLRFHNQFNTRAVSLYKVVTGERGYLFTQFEDTEAREAFPCWDEPDFKFPWTLTLMVPKDDLAISNTPVAKETTRGAMRKVEFATTKPLPSYLIAIAVGPFETVPITGMGVPGRVVTVKGASGMAGEAAKITPAIVKSLERYFGRPYPYEKLDLIAAPEFLYGAMENAGAIVFADRRLLLDPRSVDPDLRRRVVSVIAHEIAHQWFGDLVTMKWWDDLWLNESFATWMASKVMIDVQPELHAEVSSRFTIESAFEVDQRPSTRAMRAKVTALSLGETANALAYDKGQSVLDMFEGWVGVEPFRQGVLAYLKAHEWKNAEGGDLWRAIGQASGENIDAAMASFLDQAGVPIVAVEPLAGGKVRLTQSRFLTVGDPTNDRAVWRIPVTLRYPAAGSVQTKRVWLTERQTEVDLATTQPAWIEPNSGGSGYYRWSVPDAMFDALVEAPLGTRERVDLIQNLGAMLRSGRLHGDRFLALVATFSDDNDPQVTSALISALNNAREPLSTPSSRAALDHFIRVTLQPALTRVGMKPVPNEPLLTTLVRPKLLRLLANVGDTSVLDYAEQLGQAYRKDPASVPPSLAETGVVVGAYRGDRALFDEYKRRFETTNVPIERTLYLAGLGNFRDPALRKAALEYSLHGPLRPQETLSIASATATDVLAAESRFGGSFDEEIGRWMIEHYTELAAKLPPNFTTRLMTLLGGCGEDRVAAVKAFVDDPAHKMLGGAARSRRLMDEIQECATLHERESERVERWLLSRASRP
jgi:alanyl aminopeptidase